MNSSSAPIFQDGVEQDSRPTGGERRARLGRCSSSWLGTGAATDRHSAPYRRHAAPCPPWSAAPRTDRAAAGGHHGPGALLWPTAAARLPVARVGCGRRQAPRSGRARPAAGCKAPRGESALNLQALHRLVEHGLCARARGLDGRIRLRARRVHAAAGGSLLALHTRWPERAAPLHARRLRARAEP